MPCWERQGVDGRDRCPHALGSEGTLGLPRQVLVCLSAAGVLVIRGRGRHGGVEMALEWKIQWPPRCGASLSVRSAFTPSLRYPPTPHVVLYLLSSKFFADFVQSPLIYLSFFTAIVLTPLNEPSAKGLCCTDMYQTCPFPRCSLRSICPNLYFPFHA